MRSVRAAMGLSDDFDGDDDECATLTRDFVHRASVKAQQSRVHKSLLCASDTRKCNSPTRTID